MPRRHPSHFSLSQALSFLFSMQSPPVTANDSSGKQEEKLEGGKQQRLELGILTDLTHRLEHHALQRDVDELVRGLREFVEGRRKRRRSRQGKSGSSEGQQQQQQVEDQLDRLKLRPNGEGHARRWWAPVWDEEEAEEPGSAGRVLLRPDAGKDEAADDRIDWEAITVPDIVVAFDGMVVDFDRETGRPSGWR